MRSPPRVVHLIAPQPVGGAESVVRALVKARRETGAETTVVAMVPPGRKHPFVASLNAEAIPVSTVPVAARRYCAQVRDIRAAVHSLGAQLLHSHIYHADVIGCLAMRKRLPLVSTVHGITGRGLKNAIFIHADLAALRRFDAVVCVSEALERRLESAGIHRDRLYRIHNAFVPRPMLSRAEARERLGLSGEGPCVGFVGRLSYEKGPDLFVEALSVSGEDAIGVLIGDGPERALVKRRAKELGIGERIRLLGARADAASLLAAFDVIVLSSRSEASPMILFESLAAGIPTVAFDVGDISAVLNGEVGWLVTAGDVSALGTAVSNVLRHPASGASKATAAQRWLADRFGAEAWIGSLEGVYNTALDRAATG